LLKERAKLKRKGIIVSKYDSEIAAVAYVNQLTLVTQNTNDFAVSCLRRKSIDFQILQVWCNIEPLRVRVVNKMARQSITLTSPNDDWLKNQIESKEYSSKSEVVNDLIRKARAKQGEIEYIRAKLILSEKSGYIDQSKEELLIEFKKELAHEKKL